MKKPTTIHRVKGDPIEAVKSDQKPKAARGRSVPDKDDSQSKTLLKIEYLKRSKLCREYYERLKSEDLKSDDSEVPSSGEFKIRPGRSYSIYEIQGVPPPKFPEFEEWLESNIKAEDKDRNTPFVSVTDMAGNFSHYIENARIVFSDENNRDPSIDELKAHFDRQFPYDNCFCLATQFIYGTRKEYDTILNGVAELLKQKMPKKRFMEEELKRYLRVYDLREMGMKWKDIYFKIYTNRIGDAFTDEARRALLMDKTKAEKAIKKLEKDEYFWWS